MATPTAASGTSTPMQLDPEETKKSLNVSLADLSAKATALYAHKQYEEAAEVYAQAAEMQAEMNGEMSPANAEILFLYGRALFKVGQSKSDVLGGKAPEAKKQPKQKAAKEAKSADGGAPATAEKKNGATEVEGSSAAAIAEAEHKLDEVIAEATAQEAAQKKPLFQFQGDENFVDSDEEDDAEEGEGEGEEEEDDDLAVAFEVLDLARVLLTKRLEAAQAEDEAEKEKVKGKEAETETETEAATTNGDGAIVRHIKERLADTHDLLAEISLENERYPNAITDSRASLKYKEQLYPFESEIIAEAHFKLSLALEFASVTKPSEEEEGNENAPTTATNKTESSSTVDQALRDEAAAELEAAINSTKQKLQNKEVELATLHNPDDNEATRRQIADVKEVLADMEQRLVDLRRPPVDLNAALGLPPSASSSAGGAVGGSGSQEQKALSGEVSEEVRQKATDLTGLVRRKRKADELAAPLGGDDDAAAKKAREEEETRAA